MISTTIIGLFYLAELLHQFIFLSRGKKRKEDELVQKFSQKEQA